MRLLSPPLHAAFQRGQTTNDGPIVRLEPVIFELERVRDDMLIIGHASVIRCLLAYLVGLPPNEVPAVEMARGDLVEVTPASYGVMTRAFHFWSARASPLSLVLAILRPCHFRFSIQCCPCLSSPSAAEKSTSTL